jgi:EmrB/QacA subfamily drug resistance transporter
MATSPWAVFGIASAAVFLVSVDATIAVAAFPALRLSFADVSPATLSWVLNAYTIIYASLLVPAGRLVDLHGSKRLFLFGLSVFTLASLACGLAPGMKSLVVARSVQAIGGAVLTPASLALILGAFPAEKRSAIVGLWSAAGALGAAVGPGAGALLIEAASWRAAFLVNLPCGFLILFLAWRRLQRLQGADAGEGLDVPGIAMIAAGVAGLTYGIVQVKERGFLDLAVWGPSLAGVALIVAYGLWARGRKGAAIDMELFHDRTYATVTIGSFIFGIAFSMMFLSSFLFLLGVWHYSQGLTGLAVTPGPLVVIAVAIVSGKLVTRVGHRAILVTGGLMYAAAQFWLAFHVDQTPSYFTLWFPLQIVGGIAVGLLLVGLSGAAVSNLPASRFGVGGAVNNATRQLGGVFGTALAVVLIGQANADLVDFKMAFLTLAGLGCLTAAICFMLPGRSGKSAVLLRN